MQIKHILLTTALIIPSLGNAQFVCVATSENYPEIKDGLIFSTQVQSLGSQGTDQGHTKLHENKRFSFWLVGGTTIKIGDTPAKLADFYVELRDKKSTTVVRAKSSQIGAPKMAQLELVKYPKNSFLYEGLVQFSCKLYSE